MFPGSGRWVGHVTRGGDSGGVGPAGVKAEVSWLPRNQQFDHLAEEGMGSLGSLGRGRPGAQGPGAHCLGCALREQCEGEMRLCSGRLKPGACCKDHWLVHPFIRSVLTGCFLCLRHSWCWEVAGKGRATQCLSLTGLAEKGGVPALL